MNRWDTFQTPTVVIFPPEEGSDLFEARLIDSQGKPRSAFARSSNRAIAFLLQQLANTLILDDRR